MTCQRLDWLITLRWCAVVGQTVLLFIAVEILGARVPLLDVGLIIATAACSNGLLYLIPLPRRDHRPLAGGIMVLDIALLTLLLMLTGGPSNPFSIMYLVHVVMAGVLLGGTWTWITAVLSTVCYGLLFLAPGSDPHIHGATDGAYSLHLQGMWCAFALVGGLIAYFVNRVTVALRQRDERLKRMELLALNQEKLASLTTLAAGAAHELGTPLGTIAVAAHELDRVVRSLPPSRRARAALDDTALIKREVERCSSILSQMSLRAGSVLGEMPAAVEIQALARRAAESARLPERITVEVTGDAQRVVVPVKAVTQALCALLNNALDASEAGRAVVLRLGVVAHRLECRIIDRGAGMPPEVLHRIGEPFFTTKPPALGMGLGVFLARLVAERLGGGLRFESLVGEGTTAIFDVLADYTCQHGEEEIDGGRQVASAHY